MPRETVNVEGVISANERAALVQAELEPQGTSMQDVDENEDATWHKIVQQSVAQLPAWHRPRPAWMFPIVLMYFLACGMGAAPKYEIYVNLVCRAHPPQLSLATNEMGAATIHQSEDLGNGDRIPAHIATHDWSDAFHSLSFGVVVSGIRPPHGNHLSDSAKNTAARLGDPIDPAVCKHDAKVQSITSKFMMGESSATLQQLTLA